MLVYLLCFCIFHVYSHDFSSTAICRLDCTHPNIFLLKSLYIFLFKHTELDFSYVGYCTNTHVKYLTHTVEKVKKGHHIYIILCLEMIWKYCSLWL